MSLNLWLKKRSQLLKSESRRSSVRRMRLARQLRSITTLCRINHIEALETRVLPASFTWDGKLDSSWATSTGDLTNWSTDTLPQHQDTLHFTGDSTGTLSNDFPDGRSHTLSFVAGDYTITGAAIRLDNPGTDIIQLSGENLLNAPLEFSASEIDIQAGSLTVGNSVTGTAGLTKQGAGNLIFTGTASWSGSTAVQAGGLQIDGVLSDTDAVHVSADAFVGGHGSIETTVALSGTLSPGGLTTLSPIGELTVNALTMEPDSTLRMQLAGSLAGAFDVLTVTEGASLNGGLAVEFTDNYIPDPGTTFQVLTADSVSGHFSSYSGLTYPGGVLLPIRTPQGLILVATPFPTGDITVQANSHSSGQELANFFAGTTESVAFSGSLQVLSQSISGSFSVTRRDATADRPALIIIAASGVSVDFSGTAGSLISASSGSGLLILTHTGLAAELAVTVSESIDQLSLSGTFGLAINSTGVAISETVMVDGSPRTLALPAGPYVRLTADNAALTTEVLTLHGNFTLETTGSGASREILVGAADVSGFLGDNGGTPTETSDDVGVQLSEGSLLALVTATGDFALNATGTLSLQGLDQLQLSGTAALEINTTSTHIVRTLSVGGVERTLDVEADLQRLALTSVVAAFTEFVEVTGDFSVERRVDGDTTTLLLAASGVGAFLGVQRGTANEFGVGISDASAALVIEKTAGTPVKFAAETHAGTVSISGLPDLDLSGLAALEINQLGRSVNLNIPDPDGRNIPLSFLTAEDVHRFGGALDLGIDNFTRLSGNFAFEKQVDHGTLEILVAATNIEAFLGSNSDGLIGTSDDVGVKITAATLGAAFYRNADGDVSYALDARGRSAFVGLDGIQLEADLAARVNTTGGAVDETITFPDDTTVRIVFTEDELDPVFSGHVTAAAGTFATLDGFFSVTSTADSLKIAASGVTGFVGADDTGVSLSSGNLGLVIDTNSGRYALVAAGEIAVSGIDGLTATGDASVRINSLGEAITETISTP
ncbi:MAG: beta strand repeat-containing protein, partial [Planctomycetaceae bacterium]